jgi:sugar/nucleoside kinase (ribokinase family)
MKFMAATTFDIAVVGHFSMDSIILHSLPKPCSVLGGAVAFVSLVARRLGATVSVISNVGSDFLQAYSELLRVAGVDLEGVKLLKNEKTTSFELTYNSDLSARTLCLRRQGSPIMLVDLPESLSARAIHVAPIAGEISYEIVEKLRTSGGCLSIDPQGMTRRFDEAGNVGSSAQLDDRLISLIDIYKSSYEEIAVLTGQSDLKKAIKTVHDLGPRIVMVTMGAKGSILSNQGTIYEIPVFKSKRVVDPTGAGDVFIGAFLAEYVREKEPFWCACVGSAAASLVVEGVGASFLGEKDEIYRRARVIYEKEIKQ